jgi:sirohydrochlorin ferrochelatase
VVGVSDGPGHADLSTGERVKCGARVDEGVYTAFREWVEEQTGNQYYEVGRALERAMLEYMTDDDTRQILEQTRQNEALLRQVLERVDGEKVKEKSEPGSATVPQGKDPGSRRQREAYVVRALLLNGLEVVTLATLKEAIRETAEVSSQRTVKDYVDALTDTAAFQPHRTGNKWHFDHDGAREVLSRREVPVPEGRA